MLTKPSKIKEAAHAQGVNVTAAGCAELETLTAHVLAEAIKKAKAGPQIVRKGSKRSRDKPVVPRLKPEHFG